MKDDPPATPVLLVEDTLSLQLLYRSALVKAGYPVLTAASAAEGLALFRANPVRVVLLDLVLPDRDGMELMHDALRLKPDVSIIVMTAHGSIGKAVEAMRAGAHDFLVKPFDTARLLAAVAPATVVRAQAGAGAALPFIGNSPAMQTVAATVRAVARSMASVFITGESGTGKDLCARALHDQSPAAGGPFIAINCAAIPHDLQESEMFGHMKGSMARARREKAGAVARADGGTLFLDEVCDLAPALQSRLLRFLQTTSLAPAGSEGRRVKVRIVCASGRDPVEAVRRGQFRQDLFYRLHVVPIEMPPLRDRGDDVIDIAEAALTRYAGEEGKVFDGLSSDLKALLRRFAWPGNVREVLNVIRNVVVLHDGGLVTPAMLPTSMLLRADLSGKASTAMADAPESGLATLLDRPLAEVERLVIEATLARHGGSVPKAARVLALAPSTLYRKIDVWTRT